MPLSVPPELKKIAPFIKRAEELDKDTTAAESRLVAFYCRQYAVHEGIPLSTSAEGKACLGEILNDLEKEKPAMNNFTRDEAAFLCRKFAEDIFNKADAEDRAGNGGKSTARIFYAAASFLQILEQFYTEDGVDEHAEEDKKRIVYSKWKATDILKAIKEGRTPTPGGYGEDDAEDDDTLEAQPATLSPPVETVSEAEAESGVALPPALSFDAPIMPPPPLPTPAPPAEDEPEAQDEGMEVTIGPPPAYPGEDNMTFEVSPSKSKSGGLFGFGGGKSKKPSKAQFNDASELARFALAAIDEKDAELAITRLKDAIARLQC